MDFAKTFALHVPSGTDSSCMVTVGDVRFSVLASRLIRVETGAYTDEPTQKVWYRDFDRPDFTWKLESAVLYIETKDCVFKYHTRRKKMLSITVGGQKITDFKKGNLKGTYRTLDNTAGAIPLGNGVASKNGVAVLDDSDSLLMGEDGTIYPRAGSGSDVYYIAYGHDYRGAVQALLHLTGRIPLVPRYCLGNWWSRYKAYTQQEYVNLMEKFIQKEIPITVATIDMDWHWVNLKEHLLKTDPQAKPKFDWKNPLSCWWPDGWTGYSWNSELFPDYKAFLQYLKQRNFKITVNVHPAQGVRYFEDQYEAMAKAMGVDPATKNAVEFDITDPKFVDAYFTYLHHPYEKDGVDFWWIDWQQGHKTKLKGLDPLWALNHYHYMDSCKNNQRGMILSRYAEIGSHRYPLGFSGDTSVCWPAYRFQPYFTSTATNAGYSWWSHDIGGHHRAKKDDELYLRWLQFGVFSPINRLHSTSNEFMGKEPWKFRWDVEQLATEYLRLRHRLVPYIYTMNYRTYSEGLALIEPMYYAYPECGEAYQVPGEYSFGTELIAAPVTEPLNPKTNLAGVKVWLPEGRYTDVFTGQIYNGGQIYKMFRGIESFPLLAKAGAIIPLAENGRSNDSGNPADMLFMIYRGTNEFTLYEDDGESCNFEKGMFARRTFAVKEESGRIIFKLMPYKGDLNVIQPAVNYRLMFRDITSASTITVALNEALVDTDYTQEGCVTVRLENVKPTDCVTVTLKDIVPLSNRDKKEALIELISKYQAGVAYKNKKFAGFIEKPVKAPKVPPYFRQPLEEILNLKY